MDTTIVNVSLDTLQQDLHTDIATVQWVTTGYLLALALALAMPLSGWLVEKYGAKRLYVGCLIGFTAASALCGLAPSIGFLILFRVIQGAVGGLLAPLAQTLVTQIADHERLGRAMGIVALPALIGPILGPTVGGCCLGLRRHCRLLRGFAAALTILPPVAAADQDLSRAEMPKATTTLVVAQRFGSPIGTALLAVVLATRSTSESGHDSTRSHDDGAGTIPDPVASVLQ